MKTKKQCMDFNIYNFLHFNGSESCVTKIIYT